MEESRNLDLVDVLEVIDSLDFGVRYDNVLITLNKAPEDLNVVLSENVLAEDQYVIAVGSHVRDLQPGDYVSIDLDKMVTYRENPENAYEKIPVIKIDPIVHKDMTFALIPDRVVKKVYFNNRRINTSV